MKKEQYEPKKVNLADLCGIHRDSLDQYIAMPGFPAYVDGKGWPIGKCRAFIFKNSKKEDVAAANDKDYAELKRLDLYERWRKTKLANDLKEGTLILKSFMDSQLAAMASAVTAHLTTRATRVAPDVAGRSITECEKILRESDREILRTLSARVKKNADAR